MRTKRRSFVHDCALLAVAIFAASVCLVLAASAIGAVGTLLLK
jgi:hypothetical protein